MEHSGSTRRGHGLCTRLLFLATAFALACGPGQGRSETRSSIGGARSDTTRIWYLHNSGWAIETDGHLLVFDFITGTQDTVDRLMERLLTSARRENRPVVVFISHEHEDHYSGSIHGWRKQTPGILYVFGWRVRQTPDRMILGARADTLVQGLRIRTIASTDLGVGFLVQVDSLTIFHAGDHAQWDASDRVAYEREIDWLAAKTEKVDFAFVPIATGFACQATEDILDGAASALVKLRPAAAFPMHVRCADRLYLYRQFAERMRGFGRRGALTYAERQGEGFAYDRKHGRVGRLP